MGWPARLHALVYNLAKIAARILFKFIFFLRVEGSENVPLHGGVIFASNHLSNLDPPTIAMASPRIVHFMAKEELFQNVFLARLFRWLYAFPVKRSAADRQAIRTALDVLQQGNPLLIFPEGTRKMKGTLQKIERGVGFIAMKADAPVIPVIIRGEYKLFRSVTIIFGKPFFVAEMMSASGDHKSGIDEALELILTRMRELLEENPTDSTSK